ncbi:uncharacterized protein BCR38DRAFT_346452 [Pseudomassariella vexata]|uniref:Uncharacterized protein n=1 Tax=Pseudomassariella vexata TaxID=1141098 RepID=A0A1Y2DTV2_9PEZI|nr:uncharacterized protein BCR38DRAFT_346452 [Pseudomassariella vexata]ORY62599.1 hypothetical protein BCR38DRAFT_346452 [Pseudomassariella vexata]
MNSLAPVERNLILDGRGDPFTIKSLGGILAEVSTINGFPLQLTPRNTELLHYYLRFVAPNLVSIDGESQPIVFQKEVLSWQLQSPLMPNIGILMASTIQSLDRGIELDKNPESLAQKAKVLVFINQFLSGATKQGFDLIAPEAIKCVINLWFWGVGDTMRAHSRGIREMLRLRGGIRGLGDPVGECIIILTDYEIACCFEEDLYWQDGDPVKDQTMPIPTCWPEGFDSPLIPSSITFEENHYSLNVSHTAAKILDDVRFLATSITSDCSNRDSMLKTKSTAYWLYNRLKAMPRLPSEQSSTPKSELIQETIRLAALVYSGSIMSLTLFSQFLSPGILEDLYSTMMKVSLSTWKYIPGIFLWVMLILCPSTANDRRGRFIRRKMAVAGLSIGFEDFPLAISYLRGFWLVQRWIVENGEV